MKKFLVVLAVVFVVGLVVFNAQKEDDSVEVSKNISDRDVADEVVNNRDDAEADKPEVIRPEVVTTKDVDTIREENGLIPLIFFTGEHTYVYQKDAPHAVFVEVVKEKYTGFGTRYEVKYVPYVDEYDRHMTWDAGEAEWGESLDEIIQIDIED